MNQINEELAAQHKSNDFNDYFKQECLFVAQDSMREIKNNVDGADLFMNSPFKQTVPTEEANQNKSLKVGQGNQDLQSNIIENHAVLFNISPPIDDTVKDADADEDVVRRLKHMLPTASKHKSTPHVSAYLANKQIKSSLNQDTFQDKLPKKRSKPAKSVIFKKGDAMWGDL